MVQRKRKLLATVEEASNPPERLEDGQEIARVKQVAGSNLYLVQLPSDTELLVELPSRFRSTLWIKRGGYVVIDTRAFAERINKLDGEIVNVIFEEKQWKKMPYWPNEFSRRSRWSDVGEGDDADSTAGEMPPDNSSDSP